tara:strand:+ start:2049 stop:2192 length:144 start_codon:yes stop_codon:yes gene_type:complete
MDIKFKIVELTDKYLSAKTEKEKEEINNQVTKLIEDNKEECLRKGII